MEKNKTVFHYTYDDSAKQQEELRKIRQRYTPKQEDKMDQLHRLDARVSKPGKVMAMILGILGTLLLGIGMCCCMVWMEQFFIPGIIIGCFGIVGTVAAYPLYACITRKRRRKLASEVLALTDQLIQ